MSHDDVRPKAESFIPDIWLGKDVQNFGRWNTRCSRTEIDRRRECQGNAEMGPIRQTGRVFAVDDATRR